MQEGPTASSKVLVVVVVVVVAVVAYSLMRCMALPSSPIVLGSMIYANAMRSLPDTAGRGEHVRIENASLLSKASI